MYMKREMPKSIDHDKRRSISQDFDKNPVAFQHLLEEALFKYTNVDSKFREGQVICKPYFITQVSGKSSRNFNWAHK